jgi:threonyl-tRNA synthetase
VEVSCSSQLYPKIMSNQFIILQKCASEMLAAAMLDLFPHAQLAGGGWGMFGFFYNFIVQDSTFDNRILYSVIQRMEELSQKSLPFEMKEMMRGNAQSLMSSRKQKIRSKQISNENDSVVTMMQIGNFWDLCPGPFLSNTKEVMAFKIQEIIQESTDHPCSKKNFNVKIRGIASFSKKDLKKEVRRISEAENRDVLFKGSQQKLFSFPDSQNPNTPYFTRKGDSLLGLVQAYWRQAMVKEGFAIVRTPSTEAHDSPFKLKEHALLALSISEDKSKPLCLAECSLRTRNLPRNEQQSLWNSTNYSQDIAHIFCPFQELGKWLNSSLHFIEKNVMISGVLSHWRLLKGRPAKKQESALVGKENDLFLSAFKEAGRSLDVIDCNQKYSQLSLSYQDVYGGYWSGPSIELYLDLARQLPELASVANEFESLCAVRVSVLGSIERFTAWLLEQRESLPLSIAFEQFRVLPENESSIPYAECVADMAKQAGVRVYVDLRALPLELKKRLAQEDKVPFIGIVGKKEEHNRQAVLQTPGNRQEHLLPIPELVRIIVEAVRSEQTPRFLMGQLEIL